MTRKETDSEKTFVNMYSAWADKIKGGGLKVPSHEMFLLIRDY